MFEREVNPNNSTALEIISLSTLFDDVDLEPDVKSEIIELSRTNYRDISVNNTRYDNSNLIKRLDIMASLKLLKEVSKKSVQLYYHGLNIPLTIGTELFNRSAESLQNTTPQLLSSIVNDLINPHHIFMCCNSRELIGSLCFINIIKGASFLTKLKNIDLEKANTARFSYKRLKHLEIPLMENKFDNTIVIELTDIESEKRVICVLTNKHSWKKVRKTTSKILELYPDLLIEDATEEYKNKITTLITSLGEDTNDNTVWKNTILDILKSQERNNQKQIVALEKLLEYTRKEEINNIKQQINSYKNKISGWHNDIEYAYGRMRECEGKLLRIEEDPELKEKIKEALEYTSKSKLITNFTILPEERKIEGKIDAPIRYFDPEYAKALYKNLSDGTHRKKDDLKVFKQIFSKLFIEDKYTLYCSTNFQISLYTNDNTPITFRILQRESGSTLTYLGQPHLNGYSCLGNNKIEAQKACNDLDLLGLLTVLTTSAQNFNLTDSAVFNYFKEDLLYTFPDKETIRDNETGKWYSFNDLYRAYFNMEFKTTKAKEAQEKYKNSNLVEEQELQHLAKALKALGKVYVTGTVAKQLVVHMRAQSAVQLLDNAGRGSFYATITENHCVELSYSNGAITANAVNMNYYNLYDNLLNENNDELYYCFTDLLDNNTEIPTENSSETSVNIDIREVPMPF